MSGSSQLDYYNCDVLLSYSYTMMSCGLKIRQIRVYNNGKESKIEINLYVCDHRHIISYYMPIVAPYQAID